MTSTDRFRRDLAISIPTVATAGVTPALWLFCARRGDARICVSRRRRSRHEVLFQGSRAIGVEYQQHGRSCRVLAYREVILCAGVINSAQLLLLSGIGSAAELTALGLPVIVNLPQVGCNLQDHLDITLTYECPQPVTAYQWTPWYRKLAAAARWGLFKSGFASELMLPIGGFLRSRPGLAAPDIGLHVILALPGPSGRREPDREGFGVHVCNLQPDSIGRVRLLSPDPRVAPAIDPCFLSNERDIVPIRTGIRQVRRMLAESAMREFLGAELAPGSSATQDSMLDDFIRRTALTVFHPTSTCRMGADPGAVVDPALRVRGIEALRVADASIMPRVPRGNTNAPSIMIAEKAAELILQSRNPQRADTLAISA